MYTGKEYFSKNQAWHVEDSRWKALQIIKMIERNRIRPSSICEVGCGAGETLNQLHCMMANHVSFVGYEISPQAFKLCRQREKGRLRFSLINQFEDDTTCFDVVLAIDVIEHVEDYFSFLRRLRKKGALKLFHIPLDLSVQAVLRSSPILKARQNVGHIHYFTKETAFAALKETGFKILDWFYTSGSIDLPAKRFETLLARLPRKLLYGLNKDAAARILGGFSIMVLAE